MKQLLLLSLLIVQPILNAQYAPAAGQIGTTAIHKDSSLIINWATTVLDLNLGLLDIANPSGGNVTFGDSTQSLYAAEGTSGAIISLGDKGTITLGFNHPIRNGIGPDFAVFENSFSHHFLE